MNKQVFFVTSLFETKNVKSHFINDRCFGEDLANWLISRLKQSEFSFSETYQEDWGWAIEAKFDKEFFFVGIGILDESIGEENAEWLITIEAVKSWFSFKKSNLQTFEKLCQEIDKILQNESKITEVFWQD